MESKQDTTDIDAGSNLNFMNLFPLFVHVANLNFLGLAQDDGLYVRDLIFLEDSRNTFEYNEMDSVNDVISKPILQDDVEIWLQASRYFNIQRTKQSKNENKFEM